jgi:hypothetical protein
MGDLAERIAQAKAKVTDLKKQLESVKSKKFDGINTTTTSIITANIIFNI